MLFCGERKGESDLLSVLIFMVGVNLRFVEASYRGVVMFFGSRGQLGPSN
ncbi:hypothetical protein EGR_05764 [Echinococcus granulosus]|uniref:Uncharacterized protein n=1 Tax=Echinococcus granulosus TaxID=6210 RepID=W6UDJ6_ECHGR|nr:hypothetical protein EGR_05764 [Echinococcus granulosus]EUB59410.1 hypothetical protein EGR_05764 [Echinococcus granulosus]